MSWWRSRRCSATLLVLLCCPVLIGTFYYQSLTGGGPADDSNTPHRNGPSLTEKLHQQQQQHLHDYSHRQSPHEKEMRSSQTSDHDNDQPRIEPVATDTDRNNPVQPAAAAAAAADDGAFMEKQQLQSEKSSFPKQTRVERPETVELIPTVAEVALDAPAAATAVPPRRDLPYRPTASREEIRQLWKSFMESRSTSSSSSSNSNVPSRPEVGSRDFRPSSLSSTGNSVASESGQTRNKPQQQQQQQPKQPSFVPYRCPASFNISDPQDDWFRREVVQRSPLTSQFHVDDEQILILTPVSNVARHLHRYFENLCSLTYPHRLLSVVLGEDSSTDGTYEKATEHADELRSFFHHLEVVRLRDTTGGRRTGNARHDASWQLIRRRHLAMARNRLLTHALGSVGRNVRWVLWMDSDIRHIPRDLIRHLLSANQSMVTANCLWRQDDGQTATFDRNTWQETERSRAELRNMKPDELMLEGYGDTKRRFLNDLKDQGDVVPIDGVGGCVLLVDADLHRSGLVFPPFVFDHHIETEGLAKMAAKIGVRMFGLPSVNLIHW